MLFKKKENYVVNSKIIVLLKKQIKPIITITCLEKENYIITDKQADELANIIIRQAKQLNAIDIVINKLGIK